MNRSILTDYSLTISPVDTVDNQGEPCERCQLEGNVVEATVYGVLLGRDANLWVTVDCCGECVTGQILEMDPTADVIVESVLETAPASMHGPDCECVHPDAL